MYKPGEPGTEQYYKQARDYMNYKRDMLFKINLITDTNALLELLKIFISHSDYRTLKYISDRQINHIASYHLGNMRKPTQEELEEQAKYYDLSVEVLKQAYY